MLLSLSRDWILNHRPPIAIRPELPVTTWVLSDPLHHEPVCAQPTLHHQMKGAQTRWDPSSPQSTGKLAHEGAQMLGVPLPRHCLLPSSPYLWPRRNFRHQPTGRDLVRGRLHEPGRHPRVDATAPQPRPGPFLKDSDGGKSTRSAECPAAHLLGRLASWEKRPDV